MWEQEETRIPVERSANSAVKGSRRDHWREALGTLMPVLVGPPHRKEACNNTQLLDTRLTKRAQLINWGLEGAGLSAPLSIRGVLQDVAHLCAAAILQAHHAQGAAGAAGQTRRRRRLPVWRAACPAQVSCRLQSCWCEPCWDTCTSSLASPAVAAFRPVASAASAAAALRRLAAAVLY